MSGDQGAVFDDGAAARLARIKQEALRRGIVHTGTVTEQEALAEAAAGMAERRAARDDMVGGVIWGAIAAEQAGAAAEPGEAEAVGADHLPKDGRPFDQVGKNS